MLARTSRTVAAVAIVVGGFAGTVSAASTPPATGQVDGATVAVGAPPVPPSTVVEVAVGRPPVPSPDALESLVADAVGDAAVAAALSLARG